MEFILSIILPNVLCTAFVLLRMEIVYRAQKKAMRVGFKVYLRSPSCEVMVVDVRKWTFAQFYPSLAERSKSPH